MDCFFDYIGLRGAVSGIIPESGLYVNDLPGISLKSIDAVAGPDQVTYQKLWNTIQIRAIRKFRSGIYSLLNKRYRLKSIIQSVDLTKQIDNNITFAPVGQWRGFSLELSFKNTERIVASPFQISTIQELSLYLRSIPIADVPVKIIDLNTNTVLDTFTIAAATAVVGWNRIPVNKKYTSYRIFVAYDATNVQGTNLYIPNTLENYWASTVNWIYNFSFATAYVRGAQSIVPDDFTSLTYTNQSYGLSAIFSTGCTYDGLACNNKLILADALQYLLGSEIMNERIFSDRINRYTTVDLDKAKELQTYFDEQFQILLPEALEGVNLQTNDSCLECNAQIIYGEMMTI